MTYILLICISFLVFIILGVIKAELHLEYLKQIKPDEYSDYPDFSSVFFRNLNVGLQFLVLPFFSRNQALENNMALMYATKIRKLVTYQKLAIASILIIVFLLLFEQ